MTEHKCDVFSVRICTWPGGFQLLKPFPSSKIKILQFLLHNFFKTQQIQMNLYDIFCRNKEIGFSLSENDYFFFFLTYTYCISPVHTFSWLPKDDFSEYPLLWNGLYVLTRDKGAFLLLKYAHCMTMCNTAVLT